MNQSCLNSIYLPSSHNLLLLADKEIDPGGPDGEGNEVSEYYESHAGRPGLEDRTEPTRHIPAG